MMCFLMEQEEATISSQSSIAGRGAGAWREGKKVLLKRSRIPSLMAKHTRTNGDKGKEGVASWYGFKMCLAA